MLLPTITQKPPARTAIIAIPGDAGNSSEYALFNQPVLLEDPFFKKYGNACVGAYAIQLKNRVPTGVIKLAIWRSSMEYYIAPAPIAALDLTDIQAKNP